MKLRRSELHCTVEFLGSHQLKKQHKNECMGMDMENTGKHCHQFGTKINMQSKACTTLCTLSQQRLLYVMVTLIYLTSSLGYLTHWSPILPFQFYTNFNFFNILIIISTNWTAFITGAHNDIDKAPWSCISSQYLEGERGAQEQLMSQEENIWKLQWK